MKTPYGLSHRQTGFTAVSAIFILVVLTALGAAILTVSTSQHLGSAQDVQGVRAYEAARAGVEWGLYRQRQASSCIASTPVAATIGEFTVSVTCEATAGTNGGPTVYTVRSTACNQPLASGCPNTTAPGDRYIERRLDVTF